MSKEALLWAVGQVADALGISQRTVWRMASAGEIPPGIRIGRAVRWPAESIKAWIARKAAEAEKKQKS